MPEHAPGRRVLKESFRRQRRRIVLASLAFSSHQTCEALVPVAIGLIVDRAISTRDTGAITVGLLALVAGFVVLTMSYRTGLWLLRRAALAETDELRRQVLGRYLSPGGLESDRRSGEVLAISTNDAEITARTMLVAARLVGTSFGLIISAVVLFGIEWILGLVIMVGVPAVMLGLNRLAPRITHRSAARQQANGETAALGTDLLRGLRPLRGFGGERAAADRYRASSRRALDSSVVAARATSVFEGVTISAGGLLLVVVAALATVFALSGRISIGELITVVGLGQFVAEPVTGLADCIVTWANSRASADRVAELLQARLRLQRGDHELTSGDLELTDLRAGVLDQVSLRVGSGELVGVACDELVSAETLAAVLAGTRTPDGGTVTVAGTDLRTATVDGRHATVLVEPHRTDLFGETLREALITAEPGSASPPDRDLADALVAAGAADLLDRDHGLDRQLSERGLDLSGGQRQRVALARALLADRAVLVLHDPTTAVDSVTEQVVAEGLRKARQGRRTLVISTSPPILAQCDRVYLCVGGRIRAQGGHEQLLATDSDYAAAVLR